MTTERNQDQRNHDPEATVEMPRLVPMDKELEEVDPEQTLVREDWESTVIRRVAPLVAAVQSAVQSDVAEDSSGDALFGWESAGLRRLSRECGREDVSSD